MNETKQTTAQNYGWFEQTILLGLDRRILMIAAAIALAIFGLLSFANLKIDAVPDISNVQVSVTTNARGLAPREVEQYITYPVELSLQSMPRLKMQRSISKYALSQVTAIFEDGTDIYWARQQVSERLKQAQDQMPPGLDIKMALGPIATGLGEIFQFEVCGNGYSLMDLRTILDWQIIPALKTIPGVDEVQSMGGDAKEYQVLLHPEKLHGYDISVSDVASALGRNNANTGSGYILEQSDQILIRSEGMLTSTKDIEDVVVRRTENGTVRVSDLGKAIVGKKIPQSIVTQNGKGEAVIGVVIMRKGENSKQLVEKIREKMNEIRSSMPPNVSIKPFYDRGVLIDSTIDTVWHNLIHGALLVLAVLFLLLGSIRGGIVTALSIPLSLFGAFVFLSLSNTSANLLSLGALDFGILVDGSVVMTENIIRRLSRKADQSKSRLEIVKEAAAEVALPVFFAVLIISVVYLPILGLPGASGKTFQPMALTVVFGLATALFLALYVTPALSYFLLEKNPKESETWLVKLVRRPYRRLLLLCALHPLITAVCSLFVFASSIYCLPQLGTEFIPVLKEGSSVLTLTRPVSGSLETAKAQTTAVENVLTKIPEVSTVVARTGHSEIAFDPMGADETDMFVILKPREQWKAGATQQEVEDKISHLLSTNVPGLVFSMSQPIEQRMNELVAGAKADVAIRIFGPDLDKLREIGSQIKSVIANLKGSSEIKLEQTSGLPILTAKLNRSALAAYGAMAQEALDTVAAAVEGKVVGAIFEGRPRYNLTVRFQPESVKTPEEIGDLPVARTSGGLVPLSQLASISRALDAAQIAHQQGERTYMVQVNVRNRDLGGYVVDAQKTVKQKVLLPPGYHLEWGGQFENMREAQNSLSLLVPVALVLIFVLLYALYNDVRPGLLIFLNVPLAFSGGIFGLLVRGMPLSITAGVGFIALFGIAVLNGVVLVSSIRDLESRYQIGPRQAAIIATSHRLRPVLMTALVASLGFIPMAVATSVGAEVQRPLATVVIAGLITSTILTLLVVPSLYPLSKCSFKHGPRKGKASATQSEEHK